MDVYLVPIAAEEYALYTEHTEEVSRDRPADADKGWRARLRSWFRDLVAAAEGERRQSSPGVAGETTTKQRLRARVLRWIAEAVAEQRLLWHLRRATEATLVFPSDLDEAQARRIARDALGRDADRHRFWLVIDTLLFIVSGLFVVIPGPNLLAYYFLFRLIGHLLAWRGARRGLDRVSWALRPSETLAELRRAAGLTATARRQRVQDLAAQLKLEHLAAFIDRTMMPSA